MAEMLDRLHAEFAPRGALPKKMFGGVCYMLNGNMAVCTSKRGLLVRTGEAFDAIAAGRTDAQRMEMGGREMKGYWFVEGDVPDVDFRFWIDRVLEFNRTLPPK
jgi:TfoX N-terminal domain